MSEKCNRIFVYGTLMSGFDNPMSRRLRNESLLLGTGFIFGFLYDLNGYPGAVIDPDGRKVHGELYELFNMERSFSWLDEYEEGGPDDNPKYQYCRHQTMVFFQDNKINAWVYEYIQSTENLRRIESGVYSSSKTQDPGQQR